MITYRLIYQGIHMEPIIVIVGFLGVGKTTLLKKLVEEYLSDKASPFIILNDYENANLDAKDFLKLLSNEQINALSGSCICCDGLGELRSSVNDIQKREKGITLIEANGTTDAANLMGFLGVGMKEHFLPPIQLSVVDVRNWQKRGVHNELERNQVELASVIVLNYCDQISEDELQDIKRRISFLNDVAEVYQWSDFSSKLLRSARPSDKEASEFDHHKSHWSSCSVDLPDPIDSRRVEKIMNEIPKNILRVKGCTRFDNDEGYTYFERIPSGEVFVRPYYGNLVTGPKLLAIGPGSDPEMLREIIEKSSGHVNDRK